MTIFGIDQPLSELCVLPSAILFTEMNFWLRRLKLSIVKKINRNVTTMGHESSVQWVTWVVALVGYFEWPISSSIEADLS